MSEIERKTSKKYKRRILMSEEELELENSLEGSDIEKLYPISGVSTESYKLPEESKQKIKREYTKLKDARNMEYSSTQIEEDLKVLSELYERKNSSEVKALVQKYNVYNKYILKQLLVEKAKEYGIAKEIESSKDEVNFNEEEIKQDYAKLQELENALKEKLNLSKELENEKQEAFNEIQSILNGRSPNELTAEEYEKYYSLLSKTKVLTLKIKEVDISIEELKGKAINLMNKYKVNTFNDLSVSLKSKFDSIAVPSKETVPENNEPKTPQSDEKQPEPKNVEPTPAQPIITQAAPVYTISPETEKVADSKPITKDLEVALPTKSDLARRKVEGNKFSYYAPVYDKENNLTGYTFKEVDIDKEYLDDPIKAYKLALKDAARNERLWKDLNCENEKDIKKLCKELQKDFSKTYSHFQNYDECLKRILTLRSAITPEELEKAVNECEYYDKSKYEPVKVVPYEDKKFNIHSVGDFFRGLFNPNLVSLRINECLPAGTEKPETYKWPNPETGDLETLTRHRRMDRYKNKNKSKDKDSTDIEP